MSLRSDELALDDRIGGHYSHGHLRCPATLPRHWDQLGTERTGTIVSMKIVVTYATDPGYHAQAARSAAEATNQIGESSHPADHVVHSTRRPCVRSTL